LESAEKGLKALSGNVKQYPTGMGSLAAVLDCYFQDKIEIVLTGEGERLEQMLKAAYSSYLPNRVIAFDTNRNSQLPLFEGRQSEKGEVRAFVCINSVCNLPTKTVEGLISQLSGI
jgi:uncharacterized protein YyaL (SSP411 family)